MHLYDERAFTSDSATRLPLEKLTAKVGGGLSRYPRPGGLLVPAALRGLALDFEAGSRVPAAMSDEERRERGRRVVAGVERLMRTLPTTLLSMPLPSPVTVLRTCALDLRTRNVVERLAPSCLDEEPWTVVRYLRVPRLGARCFVDLLAAHEESSAPAPPHAVGRAPASVEWLRDLSQGMAERLPLTRAELGERLARLGGGEDIASLGDLARSFAAAGLVVPFRVVRRDGLELAISPDSVGVVAAVYENLARQVTAWGFTTIDAIVDRVAALKVSPVSTTLARRLLVAVPRLRWLDADRTWLSLANERSGARRTIERAFADAPALPLVELGAALTRKHVAFRRTPPPVVARYLTDVVGCSIADGVVHAPSRARGSRRPQSG